MTILKGQCVALGELLREKAHEFYAPRIAAADQLLAKAKADGHDPKNTPVMEGMFSMNYERHVQEVRDAEGSALKAAERQEEKCNSEAAPDWLADPQKASDVALTLMMLPFVELTKQYAAAHIDLGRVYHGYPLGGDNALIPKTRDAVLDALHIDGEAAKFLRDPVNATKDVGNAVGKAAGDLAKKAEKEVTDTLDKAGKTVGDTVDKARNALGL